MSEREKQERQALIAFCARNLRVTPNGVTPDQIKFVKDCVLGHTLIGEDSRTAVAYRHFPRIGTRFN